MKKIILIAVVTLGMLSCSTDDEQTKVAGPTQLEIEVKKCVELQLAHDAANRDITPPGLNLCDCVQLAIDNNKPQKN